MFLLAFSLPPSLLRISLLIFITTAIPPLLLSLLTTSPPGWSECFLPPESEDAGASEGAGAGGFRRSDSRGGADPKQQALHRQRWYGRSHVDHPVTAGTLKSALYQ